MSNVIPRCSGRLVSNRPDKNKRNPVNYAITQIIVKQQGRQKYSKDTVLESDDFPLRRSSLVVIICDNAFLPTPAKYECQAPKIWVPRDQPVSGSSP